MFPISLMFAILILLYLLYKHIFTPLYLTPLSRIPSAHWSSKLSPYWINRQRVNGKTGIASTLSAHQKYGPIVLLSPNELSTASLEGLRTIYRGNFDKDPYVLGFMNYGVHNLVSSLKANPHREGKRMMSNVYSKSYIMASKDVEKFSRVLVGRLLSVLGRDGGEGVDVYSLNPAIGADFISAYLFGLSNTTNFIMDKETRNYIISTYRMKFKHLPGEDEATKVLEDYVMAKCLDAKITVSSAENTDLDLLRDGEKDFTYPVVLAQLAAQLGKVNPPAQFVNMELELEVKKVEDRVLASEMFDQFVATIESTRVTLTYAQWLLSQHPETCASLREELRTLSPRIAPTSSDTPPQIPTSKDLDALPLLNAVLKETLRLYPPSPALLSRITPLEGKMIHGFFIPGGTVVGVSSKCLHATEHVYEEAGKWKPERWLGLEGWEEKRKEMDRWWWPFGSGGRMCIGNHLAMCMLKLCLAAMYTNFETEIVGDDDMEQEDASTAGPIGERLVLKFKPVA